MLFAQEYILENAVKAFKTAKHFWGKTIGKTPYILQLRHIKLYSQPIIQSTISINSFVS
jgi:hypothetical protein